MKDLIAQFQALLVQRKALLSQLEAQIEETRETLKERKAPKVDPSLHLLQVILCGCVLCGLWRPFYVGVLQVWRSSLVGVLWRTCNYLIWLEGRQGRQERQGFHRWILSGIVGVLRRLRSSLFFERRDRPIPGAYPFLGGSHPCSCLCSV